MGFLCPHTACRQPATRLGPHHTLLLLPPVLYTKGRTHLATPRFIVNTTTSSETHNSRLLSLLPVSPLLLPCLLPGPPEPQLKPHHTCTPSRSLHAPRQTHLHHIPTPTPKAATPVQHTLPCCPRTRIHTHTITPLPAPQLLLLLLLLLQLLQLLPLLNRNQLLRQWLQQLPSQQLLTSCHTTTSQPGPRTSPCCCCRCRLPRQPPSRLRPQHHLLHARGPQKLGHVVHVPPYDKFPFLLVQRREIYDTVHRCLQLRNQAPGAAAASPRVCAGGLGLWVVPVLLLVALVGVG